MNLTYYQILSISYLISVSLWWIYATRFHQHVAALRTTDLSKPWLKSGIVLVCGILTIGIGRLYSNDLLLPEFNLGAFRLGECINQLIIFAPFPIYLWLSGDGLPSAWIPRDNWLKRLLVGLAIAFIALTLFVLLADSRSLVDVVLDVFHVQNMHHAVQIFMEDLAIAMLLARLSAALGKRYFVWGIIMVAVLFSVGHLPGNLEDGVPIMSALLDRLNDALLVFVVGFALFRFRDFLWLFPIHYAMDMMQFYSGITT